MKKEYFENKLKEVQKLLLELDYLKNDIQAINNGKEEYFNSVIKNSVFFGRIFIHSKKLLVIDLCKLIDPTEDYSLKKLINYACSNIKELDWDEMPSYDQLKDCLLKVQSIEDQHLSGLKTLRDKHFAHLDKNRNQFTLSTRFNDCWEIIEEGKKIYNDLAGWSIGTTTIFMPIEDKIIEILKLHRFKKLWYFIQEERKLDPMNTKLEKIKDIMVGRKTP